jgi:hypothetical protein
VKSGSPNAVTWPPPNSEKRSTAYPESCRYPRSAPRWFQNVIDEQNPVGQAAPKRSSIEKLRKMSPPRTPPGMTLPSPIASSGKGRTLTLLKLPRTMRSSGAASTLAGSSRSKAAFSVAGVATGIPWSTVIGDPVPISIGNAGGGAPGRTAVA